MSTYLDQGISLLDASFPCMSSVVFLLYLRGVVLYDRGGVGLDKSPVTAGTFAQSSERFGSMKDVYYLCTAIRELRSDKEVWVSG